MAKIEIELPDELCQAIKQQKIDPGPICVKALAAVAGVAKEVREILKTTTKKALSVPQIQRRIGYRESLNPLPSGDAILTALQYLKAIGKAIEEPVVKDAPMGKAMKMSLKKKGKKTTKTMILWRKTNAAERLSKI